MGTVAPKSTKKMQIYLVGVELLNEDEQTDMTKLIVAFRNFADAPTSI
jgi:hypothetical protein